MKNIFLFITCFFITILLNAQDIKSIKIDESANGKSLSLLLAELEKKHNIDFVFNTGTLNAIKVNGISKDVYLNYYLDLVLEPFKLKVVRAKSNVYFILNEDLRWEYGKKKQSYLVYNFKGTEEQLIKGIIKDAETGESVVGAQVVVSKIGTGMLTDVNGYFQIKVPNGIHQLDVRYVGYETASFIVGFSPYGSEKTTEIGLLSTAIQLEGVTVTADGGDRNVQALVPGVEKMGMEEIKKLPTFLGEVDPVKSLTTLPGVSTVGELSSGFNVRGGETGQNLIVQDGAIIYNPTHLFGFFSAFNPDIVSDIALYKGGGPAQFGGRVSSVLDVKLRNGDASRFSVKGGVGLVSSRLGIEGPIIKNKSSYLIGGRVSYSNWLLKATDNIQLQNSSANFYDVTAKIFHRFNENNFMTVSAYRSYDDFRLASDSTFSWGTTNASIKWDHTFNEFLFSDLSISSSNYFSEVHNNSKIEPFLYQNSINNLWLKYNVVYKKLENINFTFGLEANRILLEPGQLDPLIQDSNVIPVDLSDQTVLESAAYLQNDWELSDKLAFSAGIRYSKFLRYGKDVLYTFDFNNMNGRYPAIVDTIAYKSGELIKDYGGLEPRVSIRYLINESTSLKASYYRTYQYLHLVSNTTSATPHDYWVASGPYLKPEIGDQVSLGYFKNIRGNAYEFSLEGFYKETTNAVDYIEGADITLNPALEAGLVSGRGLSYGLEVLARKNAGKFNGWVAYTYSRSLRQFKAEGLLQGINEGEYYPSAFDQPHNLSVILNYQLGSRSRTTFSTNFSYSTGRPITIPVSKFSYDAYLSVLNYSERNEYRIPDYHRLDISLTVEGKQRKNSRFRGDWVFSVFNVYSRNNAYSVFFNRYGAAKKLSILGSAFPSINYNFKF